MVALNRLYASRVALVHQATQRDKSVRKARTRTLIQIGGLVKMVGLLEPLGIEEGMDLQLNLEHQDKAAILLGLLMEASERMSEATDTEREGWKEKGIRRMKQQQAQKHYV